MREILYYFGQAFGIVAFILGFLSYQTKSAKRLLCLQTATSIVFVIHYLLIGATSGCVLNIVSVVRNFAYFNKDKKILSSKLVPYFFAMVMVVLGTLSWVDVFSLFLIAGLAINSVCLSLPNAQSIRKSILVTSPLVIVYNLHVLSIPGVIYETIAIVSSAVGIVRFRRENKKQTI